MRHVRDTAIRFGSPALHMCDIVDPYVYKLIINYLFINCRLSILSIDVDYSYMCFICVQYK